MEEDVFCPCSLVTFFIYEVLMNNKTTYVLTTQFKRKKKFRNISEIFEAVSE